MITAGRTCFAHVTTTQASERMFCRRGLPPFATLKSVQSGDAQSRSTGRPRVTSRGRASQMSPVMCAVRGWFAACTAMAVRS
jgi:hypothetical protein